MLLLRSFILILALSDVLAFSTASAVEMLSVGQRVELRAFRSAGVPLYREPYSHLLDRAPDESTAVIRAMSANQRWLNVELEEDGRIGWVVSKYVKGILSASPSGEVVLGPSSPTETEWKVWTSAETCEQVVNAGQRMAPQHPDVLRLATWNLRSFPEGGQERPTGLGADIQPTNLRWLACVLTWMNVDIVALQGLRTTPAAWDAWEMITDGLHAFTGDFWLLNTQVCSGVEAQQIGFLRNISRVGLLRTQALWSLEGRGEVTPSKLCADKETSGLYTFLKGVKREGVDFHLISLYLEDRQGFQDREQHQTVLSRLGGAIVPLLEHDDDIVVLGTFDTLGQDGSATVVEKPETVHHLVKNELPGLTLIDTKPACTAYADGKAVHLDHVLVRQGMAEAPKVEARVTGICALQACEDMDVLPPAYRFLSAHCPVVYAISNHNQDSTKAAMKP